MWKSTRAPPQQAPVPTDRRDHSNSGHLNMSFPQRPASPGAGQMEAHGQASIGLAQRGTSWSSHWSAARNSSASAASMHFAELHSPCILQNHDMHLVDTHNLCNFVHSNLHSSHNTLLDPWDLLVSFQDRTLLSSAASADHQLRFGHQLSSQLPCLEFLLLPALGHLHLHYRLAKSFPHHSLDLLLA